MGRDWIILVRMTNAGGRSRVVAIVDDDGNIVLYPSERAARQAAAEIPLCAAFGYSAVEAP